MRGRDGRGNDAQSHTHRKRVLHGDEKRVPSEMRKLVRVRIRSKMMETKIRREIKSIRGIPTSKWRYIGIIKQCQRNVNIKLRLQT